MKRSGFITIVALGAISLVAGAALAKSGHHGAPLVFEEIDANADGQITRDEMNALREMRFATVDSNGDGALSLEELETQAQERAKSRAERMIERRDANGDGQLTLDEMGDGKRADRRFDRVDSDNDGAITKAEFDTALEKMGRKHGKKGRN